MTQKTESEILFKRLCREIELPCTPITRSDCKTPDYDLLLSGNLVVAELKQFDPSDEDKAVWERLRSRGVTSAWGKSGHRVRSKLNTHTSKQFKARSNGIHPTLLVVYDNGTAAGTDSNDIKTAMFGAETITVTHWNRTVVSTSGLHPGGGRKLTADCNTTISGVALLYGPAEYSTLTVYHNHFAVNPIDPDWFRDDRFRHFKLNNTYYEWERI
jgi:hypothetical protein